MEVTENQFHLLVQEYLKPGPVSHEIVSSIVYARSLVLMG